MSWINLAERYGLAGLCLIIGYLFFDKNETISRVLLFIGVGLTIAIILFDVYLRHEELEARKDGV